jgi:hypothetical protein
MNASTPNVIEGESYPKYCANLVITSFYKNGGHFEANAALRLVPTRFDEEGNVIKKDDQYKSVLLGSLQNANEEEQQAIVQIYNAIQNYINVKGL